MWKARIFFILFFHPLSSSTNVAFAVLFATGHGKQLRIQRLDFAAALLSLAHAGLYHGSMYISLRTQNLWATDDGPTHASLSCDFQACHGALSSPSAWSCRRAARLVDFIALLLHCKSMRQCALWFMKWATGATCAKLYMDIPLSLETIKDECFVWQCPVLDRDIYKL